MTRIISDEQRGTQRDLTQPDRVIYHDIFVWLPGYWDADRITSSFMVQITRAGSRRPADAVGFVSPGAGNSSVMVFEIKGQRLIHKEEQNRPYITTFNTIMGSGGN